MPRKRGSKKSQPKFKLPKLDSNFSQVVKGSWNRSISPLRSAKLPPAVRRLPLAQNLTFGAVALLLFLFLASLGIFVFGNQLVHVWQERTSAAIVNGESIGKGALERRLVQTNGDEVVGRMIEETLILQEAKKQNVTLSQAEINGEYSSVEKEVAPQKLGELLKERHMTRDDLLRQIQVKLLTERMLGGTYNPTDQETQEYFNQNKDTLAQARGVTADKLNFADEKEEVTRELKQRFIAQHYQDWIESLKSKSKIETFL